MLCRQLYDEHMYKFISQNTFSSDFFLLSQFTSTLIYRQALTLLPSTYYCTTENKNPAYRIHKLSRRMRIVALIPRKQNKNSNRHRYTAVTLLKLSLELETIFSLAFLIFFMKTNLNSHIA